MSEAKWHYSVGGQSIGPVTSEDIVTRIRTGQIKPDNHVWCEGMANWAPVASVPEFASAAGVLTRKNIRRYVADLPEESDVTSVEVIDRHVLRPHQYVNLSVA